jgi:hypothetical protein
MNLKNAFRNTVAVVAVTAGIATMAWAKTCDLPANYMASSDSNSPNQKKQCLCHNAGPNLQKKTLCLPPGAYKAHIRHGDTAGPCP